MSHSLTALLSQSRRPRILVVGDLMLDHYLWGDATRISPEAPIPIVRVGREEHRLGGAGSVAAMLAALDAEVRLVGLTGDDPEGETVRRLAAEIGLSTQSILVDPSRRTTLKQRLLGRTDRRSPQQMARIDREDTHAVEEAVRNRLLHSIWEQLDRFDLILASDYNKGVFAGDLLRQLVAIAKAARVPVVADPARGADYERYRGCRAITPNRIEAGLAVGMQIRTPEDGLDAARRLLAYGVDAAVVTLDRDGIAWCDTRGRSRVFSVRPRQVCDITGAGDMVLSVLGFCLASGGDDPAAIELANVAGALQVERLGVVPLSRSELLAELSANPHSTRHKIVSLEELRQHLRRRAKQANGS